MQNSTTSANILFLQVQHKHEKKPNYPTARFRFFAHRFPLQFPPFVPLGTNKVKASFANSLVSAASLTTKVSCSLFFSHRVHGCITSCKQYFTLAYTISVKTDESTHGANFECSHCYMQTQVKQHKLANFTAGLNSSHSFTNNHTGCLITTYLCHLLY